MTTTTIQRTPGFLVPVVAPVSFVAAASSAPTWHRLAYGITADAVAMVTKAQPTPVVSPAPSPPV